MKHLTAAVFQWPGSAESRTPFLESGRAARLYQSCFRSKGTTLTTVMAVVALGGALWVAVRWAVINAVFIADNPNACHEATGACWATVYYHSRVVFFGLYPRYQQWRGVFAITWFVGAIGVGALGLLRSLRSLMILGIVSWGGFVLVMGGGVLGLAPVPQDQWGGLPLTIHVFLGTIVIGFPFAILLCFLRELGAASVRWVCTALIETVRAVPVLTLLFFAAVVAPLMIPGLVTPAKMSRIILALALYYGCYQAEVVRGGMRAVSPAEVESGIALGLTRFQILFLIVLPQALRVTMPATVNLIVAAFKDTSLVVVVGLFDFVASANTAVASDTWAAFSAEIYLAVALTFLVIVGALSIFGRVLERRFALVNY